MAEKLKQMGEEEQAYAENKIKVVKETFDLCQVKSGTEKVDKLRNDFIPEIKQKIREWFSCFDHSHKKRKDSLETRAELAVLRSYVGNQAILEPILLYRVLKYKQTKEQGREDCLWTHIFTFL